MKLSSVVFSVTVAIALCSCASYQNGPRQTISIHTSGINGVDCTLSNKDFSEHMIAPGEVQVERSKEPLTVSCSRAGYLDAEQTVESIKDPNYAHVNVATGFFIGSMYDVESRAIFKYPPVIIVEMKRDPNRIRYIEPERYMIEKKQPRYKGDDAADDDAKIPVMEQAIKSEKDAKEKVYDQPTPDEVIKKSLTK